MHSLVNLQFHHKYILLSSIFLNLSNLLLIIARKSESANERETELVALSAEVAVAHHAYCLWRWMYWSYRDYQCEKALHITGNKGVTSAVEWLLVHTKEEELVPDSLITVTNADSQIESSRQNMACNSSTSSNSLSKSIKCDTCNKLFSTTLEIEFHASNSGHESFSESNEDKKLLTMEQKKQHLMMLEDKLKQRRKDREESEKRKLFEKERNRIRSGKEINEAKKKLEELEFKKLFALRKKEKEDDRVARDKIKKQIEADRIARKVNATLNPSNEGLIQTSLTEKKNSKDLKKLKSNSLDLRKTKLQIRLTNGQTMTQDFGSKEQLSSVRLYIELNRTDEYGPFILMTNFPKKIFTDHDYNTPLDVLGLTPSAVIIVQKTSNDKSK